MHLLVRGGDEETFQIFPWIDLVISSIFRYITKHDTPCISQPVSTTKRQPDELALLDPQSGLQVRKYLITKMMYEASAGFDLARVLCDRITLLVLERGHPLN